MRNVEDVRLSGRSNFVGDIVSVPSLRKQQSCPVSFPIAVIVDRGALIYWLLKLPMLRAIARRFPHCPLLVDRCASDLRGG